MTNRSWTIAAVAAGMAAVVGCTSAPIGNAGCGTSESTSCMVCPKCSIEGMWAVDLPYDAMKAGWLKVEKGADGKGAVTFLWRWASPFKVDEFAIAGNTLTFRMGAGKDKWRNFSFAARGSELDCVETITDKDGKSLGSKSFKGKRIPPVGAAPDLTRAVYGAPIDLLAGGIDTWQSKEPEAHFGWTIKDDVLSNRIQRDEKGDGFGSNANLISKRDDFFDFRLSYDVRVLPKCNSGVYLRGRYEIQVIDSYGKPVDCHNMAAFYGRITPKVAAEKKANEWQHVDVTLYKRHVTVVLNGEKIIDNQPVEGVTGGAIDSNDFVPGPIYLQGDHSDADYKNMYLTPILH